MLLLSEGAAGTQTELADRAVAAFQAVTQHLAHVVGDVGVQTVFRRALVLTTPAYPWLASTKYDPAHPERTLWSALRAAFGPQQPEIAIEAFSWVLSTFVGVLERLIGEALVWRLLGEVWPSSFSQAGEGTA